MPDITLYTYEMDERCYRVRLLLSFLKLDWKPVAVNLYPAKENRKEPLIAINPTGELPVLVDGGLALFGTEAILMHLASAYDSRRTWLPETGANFALVAQWLNFSATNLHVAVTARHAAIFNQPGDVEALASLAKSALRIMDDHMRLRHVDGAHWFVAAHPTLADLVLFPAFALSRDFGLDHDEFPALRRWVRAFRALEGFKTMPGIPDYH
jgi:glutathione S-transferase